ncbi:exosortase X [Hymenobacter caeli]|uniref:Exosortase/archaeosortase family protein n=1 Tax=Hymenobacter caeli TaxID=2735894 RepID=A0ABX2FR22_9BACT|nr:exosortase/archaeosortase family protein [Hymenobacter caeli]
MMLSLPSRARPMRPAWRFLLVFAALYAAWVLGYDDLVGPNGRLDHALSVNLAAAAGTVLRLAGFAAGTGASVPTLVLLNGQPVVSVGDPCNGLLMYALFAGFVVAFPGRGRQKLWFVPLGIFAIYALNVARVALLALNHAYWYHTVDFNHHYTFTFVVYGAIGGLWALWARRSTAAPAMLAALPLHGPG